MKVPLCLSKKKKKKNEETCLHSWDYVLMMDKNLRNLLINRTKQKVGSSDFGFSFIRFFFRFQFT